MYLKKGVCEVAPMKKPQWIKIAKETRNKID